MSTPAMPRLTGHPHAPEAVYAVGAALLTVAANAAVMGFFWLRREGDGGLGVTGLAVLAVLLVGATVAIALRHPIARRATVGAISMSLVVDAVLVGYQLSETTILGAL